MYQEVGAGHRLMIDSTRVTGLQVKNEQPPLADGTPPANRKQFVMMDV